MATTTRIEWTEKTWNPLVGCRRVSPGCQACYAMVMAARIANAAQAALRDGRTLTDVQAAYSRVVKWERGGMDAADEDDKALPQWNGRVECVASMLLEPLSWRKPCRVFVNSMSDLFHEDVPGEFIDRVFAVMALAEWHTFQILTKRAERMREYMTAPLGFSLRREGRVRTTALDVVMPDGHRPGVPLQFRWPLLNVWLGVSAENRKQLLERSEHLAQTPAAIRFFSLEPLLEDVAGELQLVFSTPGPRYPTCEIDWVIVGGESGPGARPCAVEWIERVRAVCKSAGVPLFVKQMGACVVSEERSLTREEQIDFGRDPNNPLSKWAWRAGLTDRKGADVNQWPDYLGTREYPETRDGSSRA